MQLLKKPLLCWLFLLPISLFSQPLPNDACNQAVELIPNNAPLTVTNAQATVNADETPLSIPKTCIKSFENDLWYSFTTSAEYSWYKITINPQICNTPAGLQAMLIESPTCQADDFLYRSCVNPNAEKPITMFLEEKRVGVPILVYVDGYDGTICTFTIQLEGFKKDPRSEEDLLVPSIAYFSEYQPDYEPDNLQAQFANNEIILSWEHPTDQEVDFFLVEEVNKFSTDQKTATFRQKVPASSTVQADVARYEFQDISRLFPGTQRCYRIIAVNSELEKMYSEITCVQIIPIDHFFVSPVYPQGNKSMFFQYSRERKEEIFFEVLDAKGEVVKSYTLDKKADGEGSLTIDMKIYPPGIYQLRASCRGKSYLREFQLDEVAKAD